MIHVFKVGGLHVPLMVCTACGLPIKTLPEGIAMFPDTKDGRGVAVAMVHRHQKTPSGKPCSKFIEDQAVKPTGKFAYMGIEDCIADMVTTMMTYEAVTA